MTTPNNLTVASLQSYLGPWQQILGDRVQKLQRFAREARTETAGAEELDVQFAQSNYLHRNLCISGNQRVQ
jgi:hypothetical protein